MRARYADVVTGLRESYDGGAAERDGFVKESWKVAARAAFAQRMRNEGCRSLIEFGAGTGQDSLYFQEQGYDVVAIDLSPEMVRRCRAKGVDARVAHFLEPGVPDGSFDAAYALNSLLHVPDADLPAVLDGIARVLRPGGLCWIGVYGGQRHEGPLEGDSHVPPRFFSLRTDEAMREFVGAAFTVEDFHAVGQDKHRVQVLTLRRP